MTEEQEKKKFNIEIQLDEDTALGQYVNMVVAQHTPSEFVLDFVFIPPGQRKAKVLSRMILAPEHAKRLQLVLADNVGNYEKRFGEIKLTEPSLGGNVPPSKVVQ